jgi:membrane dipeptidase
MCLSVKGIIKLSKSQDDRAQALHGKSIVVSALDYQHVTDMLASNQYFAKMKKGGITAQGMTVNWPEQGFQDAMKRVYEWNQVLAQNSKDILHVLSVNDIKKAKEQKKVGVAYNFQSGSAIEYDVNFLSLFHKLGVNQSGLVYQRRNRIGDGCGERTNSGISKFGIEVIEEMNRLGILIDLVHAGEKTSLDAIEYSKDPVIFSHTNVRALCDFYYNATDKMIEAMAEKGGVICLAVVSQYLRNDGQIKGSTISDYLDHVEYVIKLVGVDNVGIGLDLFEGETMESALNSDKLFPDMFKHPYIQEKKHPIGMQSVAEVPNITKGLVARGYSDDEIMKVIGGNLLRVYGRVWK